MGRWPFPEFSTVLYVNQFVIVLSNCLTGFTGSIQILILAPETASQTACYFGNGPAGLHSQGLPGRRDAEGGALGISGVRGEGQLLAHRPVRVIRGSHQQPAQLEPEE